jgi:hypothetical protein
MPRIAVIGSPFLCGPGAFALNDASGTVIANYFGSSSGAERHTNTW